MWAVTEEFKRALDEASKPVWCERAQAHCFEQRLGRPEDAPIEPCRTCDDR